MKISLKNLILEIHLCLHILDYGRRLKDINSDENDGIDEYIYTSDDKNILDDEIHSLLQQIPIGVKTILIFDDVIVHHRLIYRILLLKI